MANFLDCSIQFLPGIGEVRARLIEAELGIFSVRDLLYFFPFRYIDRSRIYRINELTQEDEKTLVQLRVKFHGKSLNGTGSSARLSVQASDSTGFITLTWFKALKWIEPAIEPGREYVVFGRPSFFRGEVSMIHPEIEPIEKYFSIPNRAGFQGVYSTTEKLQNVLSAKIFSSIVLRALEKAKGSIEEYMPESLLQKYRIPRLEKALHDIHFPSSQQELSDARRRLKFDELFGIQLCIQAQRVGRVTARNGFYFPKVGKYFNSFYDALPFPLTEAQKRVIKEIRQDTLSHSQMNRLLQGDVGSGKTMVALASMLLAVDNGFQACIMAPTEILARQHYASFEKVCQKIGVRVAALTGTSREKERREILEKLQSGELDIIVGTHALLEDRVQFANLGFVVIDEQHRFGVEQRARLWTKNNTPPHILVMTATPIPRTLAMTLYGDLDVSVIDEMPPGRQSILTYHKTEAYRLQVFDFLRRQIKKGHQVYIVYPLIKESETMDYMNLEEGFNAIVQDFPLPEYRVTACHGQQRNEDKAESMRQFVEGEADILVATSVIEVGVDVPNATVIVIESAERFGLAQLHQLRGRVGRGQSQSYCILMSGDNISVNSRKRLEAMCETTDGFRLSELDMQLRGAGDVNGVRQSGEAQGLRLASLSEDGRMLEVARDEATAILEKDPDLSSPEFSSLKLLQARFRNIYKGDFSEIS